MIGKEGILPLVKYKLTTGVRALSAGVIVGGFSAGFNPSTQVSTDSHFHQNEAHLVLENNPFDVSNTRPSDFRELSFSDVKPDLSTEDADKIMETAFVSAYMIGMWAQVRKNLEIAKPNEKRFGWAGIVVQSLVATYGIARIWDADFSVSQDDLDNAAIVGFILGYISTKGALTSRGMSNGLPWSKAIAKSGLVVEAAVSAYAVARVTKVIE